MPHVALSLKKKNYIYIFFRRNHRIFDTSVTPFLEMCEEGVKHEDTAVPKFWKGQFLGMGHISSSSCLRRKLYAIYI